MKKTNVASIHSATRWLRYLPLLLCFIVFGSSGLAAQNFKAPVDAAISVKEELEQVIGDLSTTNERVDLVSSSQKQTNFNFRYYTEFLDQLSESNDTGNAMSALDRIYPVERLEGVQDIALKAREDLMDLITN